MNKRRFIRVLEAIEANPEHWNQNHWHCGTSHCFAGFAELQKFGLKSSLSEDEVRGILVHRALFSTFLTAQYYLGLDSDQASWLFSSARTLDDFRRVRLMYCR